MIALVFRYFFIILCGLYTYTKIHSVSFTSKTFSTAFIIFSLLSSCIISLDFCNITIFKIIIMLITSCIFLSLLTHRNIFSICTPIIISYGISFVFFILSNTLISIVFFLIYKSPSLVPYTFTYYPTGILHFILVYFALSIKQFCTGISLLLHKRIFTDAILLSTFLIICVYSPSNNRNVNSLFKLYVLSVLITFSFLLLYYWRYRIKQTYIENMRRLETLGYENTIADKNKQIEKLKQENTDLGQIIHKYRKTIPAMELSVMELLQSGANLSKEEFMERANTLHTQLVEIRNERNNMLDHYQRDTVVTTHSGLHTIDALLALMEKRAKQDFIRYKTQIDPTLKELALNSIKESDLLHLLGDFIENAIHAVSLTEDRKIFIHLGKLNDCLLLEVSDNGIAFDIQTYQHFGNEPYTSHQADGGSGTGLMDIWRLKKEYKASLYIYEYSSEHEVYTKKISLLFDRKNHFLLKTYRDKEIKNSLIRGDLYVFPHQTD